MTAKKPAIKISTFSKGIRLEQKLPALVARHLHAQNAMAATAPAIVQDLLLVLGRLQSQTALELMLWNYAHDLVAEAKVQRKSYLAASDKVQRPKNYRPPVLPAPFKALQPVENASLTTAAQTETNYEASLLALQLVFSLYLELAQTSYAGTPVRVHHAGDDFLVYLPEGRTLKSLATAGKQVHRTLLQIDPDNHYDVVVAGLIALAGFPCQTLDLSIHL